MHHLYPNFYSLASASSQPLDPRIRRRSIIGLPAATASPLRMDHKPMEVLLLTDQFSHSAPGSTTGHVLRRQKTGQPTTSYSTVTGAEPTTHNIVRNYHSSGPGSLGCTLPPPTSFADVQDTTNSAPVDTRSEKPGNVDSGTSTQDGFYVFEQTTPHTIPRHHRASSETPRVNGTTPLLVTVPGVPVGRITPVHITSTGGPHPMESLWLDPSIPTGIIAPEPRQQFIAQTTTYGQPFYQPVQLQPQYISMRPAISLQCLDKIRFSQPNSYPVAHSKITTSSTRSRLFTGLKDLRRSSKSIFKRAQAPSPAVQIEAMETVPEAPSVAYSTVGRTRMNSNPLSQWNVYRVESLPPQPLKSVPVVRRSEGSRKEKNNDRHRALWGVPCPELVPTAYIPVNATQPLPVNETVGTTDALEYRPVYVPLDPHGLSGSTQYLSSLSHAWDGMQMSAHGLESLRSDMASMPIEEDRISVSTVGRRHKFGRRAHVVSAFEQSLNSMSQRLQALTHTTAKKDSELHQLRATIEELRSKSGLSTTKPSNQDESKKDIEGQSNSGSSDVTTTAEQSTENEQTETKHQPNGFTPAEISPQKKALIPSSKSAISTSKKNGWFRASIGKAFRKKQSPSHGYPSQSDSEGVHQSDSGPLHVGTPASRGAHSTNAADDPEQTRNTLHTPSSQNGPAAVDGLSPSNSSTSSSSWSTSGISASGTSNNTGPQAPSNEADRSDTTSIGQDKGSDSQTPQFLRHEGLVSKENTVNESAKPVSTQSSEHDAASGHREQDHNFPSSTEDQGVTEPNITVLQAEVSRLRHQLSERELKLTDVQLEALASTHQVNQLRDQMSRMYSELQHLRSDNERLQMMLQQQQQPTEDLPVSSTLNGWKHMNEMGGTNLERRKISGSDSAVSKSRIAPGCPQRHDSLDSSAKHHFDIFDGAAGYPVIQSSKDGAIVSNEHQTLYAVVCYRLGQNDGDEKADVVQAGLVNLRRFSDWIELDSYLMQLFAEYVRRLDPTNRLCSEHAQLAGYELTSSTSDLSCTRIFQLQQGSVSHQVKDLRTGKQTSTLPVSGYATFLDACCDPVGSPRIHMHIPCSPDGYSFELILRYFLPPLLIQSYVQLLLKYGCLVLYQPGGIGRENLAYSLAQSMYTARHISQIIRLSWSNVKTTSQQLLNCLTSHPEKPKKGSSEKVKISKVIMVDRMENTDLKDLHHVLENVKFDDYRKPLMDDAEAKESRFPTSKFYIIGNWIGTKNDVPEFPSSIQSTILDHFNITVRWSADPSSCWVPVGFQTVEESSLYLAHRVRQKLIHKAVQKALDHRLVGTPFLPVQLESVKNLIGWLQEVWKLIGLLVERLRKAKANAAPPLALSPDIFTDPPVADCASVEKWFINCWNTTIATRIHELIGQVTSESPDKNGEDPTVWVIKTWPWRKLEQDEEKNLLVPLIH